MGGGMGKWGEGENGGSGERRGIFSEQFT